jgi:hypothetical protein
MPRHPRAPIDDRHTPACTSQAKRKRSRHHASDPVLVFMKEAMVVKGVWGVSPGLIAMVQRWS